MLTGLRDTELSKSLYEIIVVDNGSVENIKFLVSQFPQTSFTNEPQPGSYAARNKGISIARER